MGYEGSSGQISGTCFEAINTLAVTRLPLKHIVKGFEFISTIKFGFCFFSDVENFRIFFNHMLCNDSNILGTHGVFFVRFRTWIDIITQIGIIETRGVDNFSISDSPFFELGFHFVNKFTFCSSNFLS